MTTSSPDLVREILSKIPDSENGNIKAGAIEIVGKLPKEKMLELIPSVLRWMKIGTQFFSVMKSIELIEILSNGNETEAALSISKELLEFVPEEAPVLSETDYVPSRDPKTFIDHWHYARFLHDNFPLVAKKDPVRSLKLLIYLFEKHCGLSHPKRTDEPYADYSFIARSAIETSEHLHRDDVDDALIDTILRVAIEAIGADQAILVSVIEELEKQPWPVFKRIVLYLIADTPQLFPKSLLNISLV